MTKEPEVKSTVQINQPVDKEVYKKIKIRAVTEGKHVQEVVNDALAYFSRSNIQNIKPKL